MDIKFQIPGDSDMAIVKKYIAEFMLDDTEMSPEQFLIAKRDGKILGFGRLKNYNGVIELGTLGVLPEFQKKHIGVSLVNELVKIARDPIYTVCVIPEFFIKCGFEIVHEYPSEIKAKLNFCVNKWPAWPESDYKILKHDKASAPAPSLKERAG